MTAVVAPGVSNVEIVIVIELGANAIAYARTRGGSAPPAPGALLGLRLRANGSSLSVDVNGVTQISASDVTVSSGQAGVWSYQPSSARAHSVDDFTIVQLGASLGGAKVLAKPIAAPRAQTAPQPPPVVTKYYPFNGQRIAMRARRAEFMADRDAVKRLMQLGAEKARAIGALTMKDVRRLAGLPK